MRHPNPRVFANWHDWADQLVQVLDLGTPPLHYHDNLPSTAVGDVRGGNYLEIETDGTLEMHGTATVWRDELGDITRFKATGSRITEDAAEGTMVFATNCVAGTDYLYTNIQLNHDRLLGSKVNPHLHWFQAENNKPHWLLSYRWQKNNAAKVTSWTNYKLDTSAYTYTSGTLVQISYNTAGLTPPSGDGISDVLQFRLTRDTTSTVYVGADPYTTSVHGLSFDVHIETDTLGSRTEYSK